MERVVVLGHICPLGILRAIRRELKSVIRNHESSLTVYTYSSHVIYWLDHWGPLWRQRVASDGVWRNRQGNDICYGSRFEFQGILPDF